MNITISIFAGLLGGIAMTLWFMFMNVIGFTTLDFDAYNGCLLTGEKDSDKSFIVSLMMHAVCSVAIAFIYAWFMQTLWGYTSPYIGLVLALPHWAISGLSITIFDSIDSCVSNKKLIPMGIFASGYGISGMITFLIGHLIYGFVVGWFITI